ncbi:manganese efflux pump MntP [Anaerocolumna chitinilytica]|uniref:Putative manganese efflux pump MntP n=1 Tax=Anaerocolumna chitinilytica TaxID=1727145 RepID=A0A7I8DKG5_9FIRM|nr:manganese efflux pump MntP family protein [Anaerocolumna chitinilytica]BCJ98850.1 membrane protein [Anaerocolumna chitinilytica]
MNLLELLILSVGLAMDAFAVAVCKGLSIKKISVKHPVIVGLYFGIFQAVMPLIGYFLGKQFSDKISAIDHWVAFILLGIIGINMIRGSIKEEDEEAECENCKDVDNSLKVKEMLILSVATSIDALAVGITFAFLKVNILAATSFIGVVTFLISAAGVYIGNIFGGKLKSKAEMAGGIILVCLGTKILLQHLGILG